MQNSNKKFLEDLEGKLNGTSGLRESAKIIESKRVEMLNVFNDHITEGDKEKINKIREVYVKKETQFSQAVTEAKVDGMQLANPEQFVALLEKISNRSLLDDPTLPVGTGEYKAPEDFFNNTWNLLGNDLSNRADYHTKVKDIESTISTTKIKALDGLTDKDFAGISAEHVAAKTDFDTKQSELANLTTAKGTKSRILTDAKTLLDNELKYNTNYAVDPLKSYKKNFDLAQTELQNLQTQYNNKEEELQKAKEELEKAQKNLDLITSKIGVARKAFTTLKISRTDFLKDTKEKSTVTNMLTLSSLLKEKLSGKKFGEKDPDTYHYLEEMSSLYDESLSPAVTGLVHSREVISKIDEVLNKPKELLKTADHKDKIKGLYEELETVDKFDINKLLERIHDKHYVAILEYALDDFFKEYPAEKAKWEKLNSDQKRFFFDELIIKTRKPAWKGTHIPEIDKKNNLSKDAFYAVFKDKIISDYPGDITDKIELKKFIEEKVGTFTFAEPNPEYALGLMRDKIKEKYSSKEAAIGVEFNKYMWGLDDGSVAVTTPAIPGIADVKELGAVVADTESITEEQARDEAMKDIEKEYADSMPYGFTRAKLFFFRSRYVNKKIEEKLGKSTGKLITDGEVTNAVNRWHLKKALNMAGADKIEEDDSMFNDPIFNEKLNLLVNDFVTGSSATMSEQEFEAAVRKLIDQNPELKSYMKEKDVSQIGTNFLELVKSEKTEREYYGKLIELIDRHGRQVNTPEFDAEVRALFAEFVKENKKLPELVKELKLDIDAKNFSEKLATHREALHKMKLRNVKMKLSMLTNTDKEDKGLTAANSVNIDKLGGRGKFYKWMEKHPWRTAIGTSASLVGTAALGAATIPALGLGLGASALFALNFIKKKGHYTKEHMKFEQDLLAMTTEDRDAYIKTLENDAKKSSSAMRWLFPKKFDKYADSLSYIQEVSSLQIHIDNLNRYLTSGTRLSGSERLAMEQYLTDAIATMHLREDEGRNFTFSDEGKAQIEKKYNELHTAIKAGLTRYDPTQNPDAVLSALSGQVGTSADTIKTDSQYDASQNRMRKMRTKLGLFAGVKAAGIYLISAYVVGQIREGRSHLFGSDAAANVPGVLPGHVDSNLPVGIESQISKDLGRTIDFNNLQPSDTKDVLDWLTNHGYNAKPSITDPQHVVEIFKSTVTSGTSPSGLHLDPAFGVDAAGNADGHILLKEVFAGDTSKFEAFKLKMSGLSAGDRSTTLWDTLKDLYGGDYGTANAKTHKFFDLFGDKIMEGQNYELVQLTKANPLTSSGADAIAAKMSHRYTNAGMLTGSELKTVTDPSQIKDLFDGFAAGKINLGNPSTYPSGWNIHTINDALHCKYGGFGDGLKDYIFDLGGDGHGGSSLTEKIGDLTQILDKTDGGGDGSTGWNFARVNSFGAPSVWNEINEFRNKKA